MENPYQRYVNASHNEPVDERRNSTHMNFVPAALLSDRLIAQPYRSEIVQALKELRKRHNCVSLGSMSSRKIQQGTTPVYGNDGPPCIKLKHVRHVMLEAEADVCVSADFALANPASAVRGEAIFVNRQGGFTVGRSAVYLDDADVFPSDSVFTVVPDSSFDAAFVTCYLNSWWGKRCLEAGINGSTGQLVLPQSHVENLPIPVVSMTFQRAIGNQVRYAAQLLQESAAHEKRLHELLTQHLPYDAVDDSSGNDSPGRKRQWFVASHEVDTRLDAEYYRPEYLTILRSLNAALETRSLGEIEDAGGYGTLPPSSSYGGGTLPLLRGGDLNGSVLSFIPEDTPRVPEQFLSRATAKVNQCEVLLLIKGASIGAPESVGVVARDWTTPAIVNGSIYKFSVKHDVNPFYVCAFMRTYFGLCQKTRAIANTGINYNDQDCIRAFRIALPDRVVQDEIGAHLEQADKCASESRRFVLSAMDDTKNLLSGSLDERDIALRGEEVSRLLNSKRSTE